MELKEYLDLAVSPYHVVQAVERRLEECGFLPLAINEIDGAKPGNYYIDLYGTGVIAMRLTGGPVRIFSAHTDYPCFKVKPVPEAGGSAGCMRAAAEPYGGMLKRTWFDRPLGIAGRVWVRSDSPLSPEERTVKSDTPAFVIPSLAPHMDHDIETKKIDLQKEMMPLYAVSGEEGFLDYLAGISGCGGEDILSYDLNLYPFEEAVNTGVSGEMILSKGIDNIASVAALTEAVCREKERDYSPVICLFNNEEIGSATKQGGASLVLPEVLERLGKAGLIRDIYEKGSFLISADGAHAVHPAYPEKSDSCSKAEMGKGIVIKTSASQRYATDGYMIAVMKEICEREGIAFQLQANRSGSPGGSTLGPILSTKVPIPAADTGIPMLAMHSARELACVSDYEAFRKLFEVLI